MKKPLPGETVLTYWTLAVWAGIIGIFVLLVVFE